MSLFDKKKKTYGEIVAQNWQKNPGQEDHITEYGYAFSHQLLKDINAVIDDAVKNVVFKGKNFYIGVYRRIERIGKVPHTYIKARLSPQTPIYDCCLYKYWEADSRLERLWLLPSEMRYWELWHNRQERLQDKKWAEITKFVVLNETGELLKWTQQENNEDPHEKIVAIPKENPA